MNAQWTSRQLDAGMPGQRQPANDSRANDSGQALHSLRSWLTQTVQQRPICGVFEQMDHS